MKSVKKAVLVVFVCCFSGIGLSQEPSKKSKTMATIICECLGNKSQGELDDFENTLNDCYRASVLGALLSGIDTSKDNTISLNTDGTSDKITDKDKEQAINILNEDCEIFKSIVQNYQATDPKVAAVSEASCRCIGTIPTDIALEDKNAAIQECIMNAKSQLREELDIQTNTVEEIRSFHNEVYSDLVETCPAVEIVTFANDQEKLYSYSANDKAMEYYSKALDYGENEQYDKAIKYYEKAVKKDSMFVFAWDNLGRSYRQVNRIDDAINAYKKSISIDSLNRTSVMNLAVAYNYKKDFSNSELWYQKLITLNKSDPEGYYGLSLSLMYQNKLEESLSRIIEAHSLYQEQGSPYVSDAKKVMRYLGTLFKDSKKLDYFNKVLEEQNIKL